MTTQTDLIYDEIATGIEKAEAMGLTRKQGAFLRGFVSDYLDYLVEGEGKQDETTTSPFNERSI